MRDNLGEVAYYDFDAINYTNSRMYNNLYFNLGNGLFIRTYLAKGDDGIYYFLTEEMRDGKLIPIWYKLSDEYIDEFEKMILECEEKEKIMNESLFQ